MLTSDNVLIIGAATVLYFNRSKPSSFYGLLGNAYPTEREISVLE